MQSNRLMEQLGHQDHRQIFAAFDKVDLRIGDILCEPDSRIQHVYFPLDCLVSQRVPIDAREHLELTLVGREGMLGTPLILGMNSSNLQTLVRGSGTALRIGAAAFCRELERHVSLRQHLNRYVYVLQAQLALTAACNRLHSLDVRLARYLLMTHDRAGLHNFQLTHKLLAQMLGVRRVGVTNAAGFLQKEKILSYRRGEITILNRAGLEQVSCSCYQASQDVYTSVLG